MLEDTTRRTYVGYMTAAVSVAFALRGDFPWRRVPAYIAAQLIGAILATLLLWALLGKQGSAGLTLPGAGVSTTTAMLWEIVLTTGLVSVILGTASGAQQIGPLATIGVGGYIALAGLWGSPVGGASMNPARSLGPALGVSGRASGRRGDRGGHRLRPAGSRRRPQRGCRRTGHTRRKRASGPPGAPLSIGVGIDNSSPWRVITAVPDGAECPGALAPLPGHVSGFLSRVARTAGPARRH